MDESLRTLLVALQVSRVHVQYFVGMLEKYVALLQESLRYIKGLEDRIAGGGGGKSGAVTLRGLLSPLSLRKAQRERLRLTESIRLLTEEVIKGRRTIVLNGSDTPDSLRRKREEEEVEEGMKIHQVALLKCYAMIMKCIQTHFTLTTPSDVTRVLHPSGHLEENVRERQSDINDLMNIFPLWYRMNMVRSVCV